ncbi:MAG: aspartate/glutamate racemase family protein [Desulfosarcinaceae bacterium]|nr:aspartate/glutamate racemase family protein [Desulfosarcinaceae bacterium]
MKTIGLIGGMSWESTQTYYRILNETVKARLGGLHSAKILLYSVDFGEVEAWMRADDWAAVEHHLTRIARRLKRAGADLLLICTNTMHRLAAAVEAAAELPLLHIADPTADAIKARGLQRVALLGTRITMEAPFYRQRLETGGLAVLTPTASQRQQVDEIIFKELCLGKILPASRIVYRDIIADLAAAGAQGVILGCTEIGLLIGPQDSPLPLFDTTELHAQAAVEMAMAEVNRIVG